MPVRNENGKRREATEEERIHAIAMHLKGYSYHQIQQYTGYGKSAIQRMVKHWEEEKNVKDARHCGRQSKLSRSDKKRIATIIENDPVITIKEIRQQFRFSVSERLIGNEVRAKEYCSFVTQKQEILLPSYRVKILA